MGGGPLSSNIRHSCFSRMTENTTNPSDALLEIGRKFHPRRYRRFKDLRPSDEVECWARTLEWQNNPYDRFLLRREMLHYLESTVIYHSHKNIFKFASRSEIEAEVDRQIEAFGQRMRAQPHPIDNVFNYVSIRVVWNLVAVKHLGKGPFDSEDFKAQQG